MMTDMSTHELIQRLQEADPEGNRTVQFACHLSHNTCYELPISAVCVDGYFVVLS